MHHFIYPSKTAWISSGSNSATTGISQRDQNFGQDEILELCKERGNTDNRLYPSRILLKFDKNKIYERVKEAGFKGQSPYLMGSSNFDSKNGTDAYVNAYGQIGNVFKGATRLFTASLELTCANAQNITSTQVINVYHVSQSWEEGSGRYSNLPTSSDGVSWVYRDDSTNKTQWRTSSFEEETNHFHSTGNVSGTLLLTGATRASASILFSGSFMGNLGVLGTGGQGVVSGSAHQLTIGDVDFIPVISSSLFISGSTQKERYFNIGSTSFFTKYNLVNAINSASALGDGLLKISASHEYTGGGGASSMTN